MWIGNGRAAGLIYLVVVASGIFSLAFVPSRVPLSGDAASIVTGVLAGETLFRLGILASLICYVAFLILPLALYRLLHDIDRSAAVLMVALAVASVPIALAGVQARFGLIAIVHQASQALPVVSTIEIDDAVRTARGNMLIAQLFWGLWLLPLGRLILKSAAVPRLLGALLILGGIGYVATVAGTVLIAEFGSFAVAHWLRLPGSIGEIGTALWLSIFGAYGSDNVERRHRDA